MRAQVKSKLDLEERTTLQDVIPLETPFLLYVDPSSACNFRCQFCPTGHIDLLKASEYKRRVMNLGLFEKLLTDLRFSAARQGHAYEQDRRASSQLKTFPQ